MDFFKKKISPQQQQQQESYQQFHDEQKEQTKDEGTAQNNKVVSHNFLESATMAIETKAQSVVKSVKESAQSIGHIDDVVKQAIMKQKQKINVWIKLKIEEKLVAFLEGYRPKIKQKIADKHLFAPIQRMAEDIVDENWPILTDEIRYQLRMSEFQPYVEMPDPDKASCCTKLKGLYLYTVMPYDKTIGDILRDWKWYIFLIITLIPFYGVQCFFYLFIFYCIDKDDEFQLISYILDFKKMQFFTIGCIQGVLGYYLYYSCVDLVPESSKAHIFGFCLQNGPGANMEIIPDLLSFFLNLLLVWMALFYLPFSQQKGKPKFKLLDQAQISQVDEAPKGCCSCFNWDRGGRLKYIMLWDILSFVASFLIFYYSIKFMGYDNYDKINDWKPYIFFSKWVYGILSFPFLLFSVPIISSLLVRCRPTAYDQYGNCVPEKGVEINYGQQEDILNIDIEDMMTNSDSLVQEKSKE